jgi:hypothetical protein
MMRQRGAGNVPASSRADAASAVRPITDPVNAPSRRGSPRARARAGREPRLLGWVRRPGCAELGFLLYSYALANPGYPQAKSLEIRIPNKVLATVGVLRSVNCFLGESGSHGCSWLQLVSTL